MEIITENGKISNEFIAHCKSNAETLMPGFCAEQSKLNGKTYEQFLDYAFDAGIIIRSLVPAAEFFEWLNV